MEVTAKKIPLTREERLEFGGVLRLPATWEEFLDALEQSEYRMEYDGCQIISFVGFGTEQHEKLTAKIIHLFSMLLSEDHFRVYGSNLALHVPKGSRKYYNADCTIVKGDPEMMELRDRMKAVANPLLPFPFWMKGNCVWRKFTGR